MSRTSCFMIGITAALMAGAAVAAQPIARQMASPLDAAPGIAVSAGFMLPLQLNVEGYAELQEVDAVRLTGFPLAPGQRVDLEMQRFDVLARDARIVVSHGDVDVETDRPDVVLLRGHVTGVNDSSVFLALSHHGSNGFIRLPHRSWIVATPLGVMAPDGAPLPTVIYSLDTLPNGAIEWLQPTCGADALDELPQRLDHLLHRAAMQPRLPGGAADDLPCRRVRIAVDTDWQYATDVFSGNTAGAQAYIVTLLGAVSEIFVREVNTSLEIVYMRVWTANNTPYSATSVNDRLTEFRDHWNANMSSVTRHVAHMLTGLRAGAGGVAWTGELCSGIHSYGASGYINGSFPYPIAHNQPQNWDLMVVAHEIGHNFGAPHTHSLSPPIDGCGLGDCSMASHGTIMSYCHTCSGGMSNIRMDLHTRIINERIVPYLNSATCAASLLCPGYSGRCCLSTGDCQMVIAESECRLVPGATFGGLGTDCAGSTCPLPGACCLADGTCVMVPEPSCAAAFSGSFRGASVDCGTGRCAESPMLWNSGPLVTDVGAGCSGRDVCAVPTLIGNITHAYSWSASGNRIADQFIVPVGDAWEIQSAVFFGYLDSSTPTFTSVRIQIWDGDPRGPGSSVVAGDLSTNRLTSPTMTDIHRQWQTQMTLCSRRIQRLECSLQVTLQPGAYWIERAATGSAFAYMPPVTFPNMRGKPGGRALHFTLGSWRPVVDQWTNVPQDMPFVLLGNRLSTCYANCDGSTAVPALSVDDFMCFINSFTLAQLLSNPQQISHYANCDQSTIAPVLNVDDFTCFINQYAQGCP